MIGEGVRDRLRRRRRRGRAPAGASPGTIVIDPEAPRPRIRVIDYGPDELLETEVQEPEKLDRFLGDRSVTWVNVDGLGDEAVLRSIGEMFDLHKLALEDVVNVHQRPKVETYGDHVFVVARMARLAEGLETEQLSLFLGPDFVLTFQERQGDVFDPVRARIRGGRRQMRSGGPDYLAYALLDAVIDGYFPVLEHYGERLEAMEEEIIDRPASGSLERIHDLKRELLVLRRAMWPHRDVVNSLQRDVTDLVSDETRIYLRDCYDHTIQLMDLVENYRELGSSLADLYLSSISHRMNEVMQVLTIFAAIFIPLTFIAGIYGMNFDPAASPWNMPELDWYWGYPFAWGLMATLTLVMLIYFRRKGWIGWEEGEDSRASRDDRHGDPSSSTER